MATNSKRYPTKFKLKYLGPRRYRVTATTIFPTAGFEKKRAKKPHVPKGQKVSARSYPLTLPFAAPTGPVASVRTEVKRRSTVKLRKNDRFITVFIVIDKKVVIKRRLRV